jgi:putative radical SAM enzyme (TIGR03279 family)
VRSSLHLRDDDFRLSFTYGSYVTLTNLGPRGFQRLIDQKLSPLYVSVHATDPDVRMRLLGVPRGGDILERLERLLEAGIEVHTQVVLCPEWNDGAELDRTMEDLWRLGPGILTLSVVPVGLTQYNLERPVRLLRPWEVRAAIAQVDAVRDRALGERGLGWAYAADEMFLLAGHPIPSGRYYDDWPLTENGVGAVRALLDDIEALVSDPPFLDGLRVGLVTGTRMGEVLAPLLPRVAAATGAQLSLLPVENRLFGPSVTTAGLLPGADVLDAVRAAEAAGALDVVLVPAEALNDDGLFIDSLPFGTLASAITALVIPAHTLTGALSSL